MPFTRKNVWELGGDWADPILWYARGVAAMKAQGLDHPTAWRFYGAIHGFNSGLWGELGYYKHGEPMPTKHIQSTFWKQCHHGSWYFLPWHRGYLIAFEANIRFQVAKLGGPSDWTLPYWNYFKAGQSSLPKAFASADWPDGKGNNPLFVTQRYGPNNDGNVFVPTSQVNLNALGVSEFTGVGSGGDPGFGGVDTGFMHGGTTHGDVETQPHDWVHGLVGGSDPSNQNIPGVMSDPDSAALDPIFWLHHANIDRLWEVWRQNPPAHVNPTDLSWMHGPAGRGQRAFAMPMPDGETWNYTPADMADLSKQNYTYDDFSPAVPAAAPGARLARLGLAPAAGGPAVTEKNVELVGASSQVNLQDGETAATVQLDKSVVSKVSSSLAKSAAPPAPDRVFLNLENVRGLADSTAFHVYVGVPQGEKPADHPELMAGSIALFGVRKASDPDEEHGGKGLTYVLDISNIVDGMHLGNKLDVDKLDVRLVPVRPVPASAQVTIGRIGIYRQGR